SDVAHLRTKTQDAQKRQIRADADLVPGRPVSGEHVRRLATVAALQVVEGHTALHVRVKERDAGHRELHARRHTLQRVLTISLASRRLAIELDAIEAGIDADEAHRYRGVKTVAESRLGSFDDRGVRCGGLTLLRERSRRKAARSPQPDRDRLRGQRGGGADE